MTKLCFCTSLYYLAIMTSKCLTGCFLRGFLFQEMYFAKTNIYKNSIFISVQTVSCSYRPFGPRSWMKDNWLTSMNSICRRNQTNMFIYPVTVNKTLYYPEIVDKELSSRWRGSSCTSNSSAKCSSNLRVVSGMVREKLK